MNILNNKTYIMLVNKCLPNLSYVRWKSIGEATKNKSSWISVVGLEVHAQIDSNSKLFSGAKNDFASAVNTSVSLFDASIPGTLPVLNKKCVEAGIMTALALSSNINSISTFDRKHYFYADLPAGYQITQQRNPLATGGQLNFQVFTPGVHKKPYSKTARLVQIQLEQDSGKSLHDDRMSMVDLNRAGAPLMELVFCPDLTDGEEAAALIKELILILESLGTCSCKMEEGALRVDANISMHKPGTPLGTRSEVKNIGSVRGVAGAIAYEINRQREILESGGVVINETRTWDAPSKSTLPMRDKETKQDYRFMPEPNLPPLRVVTADGKNSNFKDLISVSKLQNSLPELPEQTRQRLIQKYGLRSEIAITIVNDTYLYKYFWSIINESNTARDSKLVANIIVNEFLMLLNKNKLNIEDCTITPNTLGELIDLLQAEILSSITARIILQDILDGNNLSPTEIMKQKNLSQITSEEELTQLCKSILLKNPKMVKQFKAGKQKVLFALIGEVAKESNNRAKMSAIPNILQTLLKQSN